MWKMFAVSLSISLLHVDIFLSVYLSIFISIFILPSVSEALTEAVRIIPVTQGVTGLPTASLWVTNNRPPDLTLLSVDPTPTTPEPWRAHLDLHRRTSTPPVVAFTLTPPARTSTIAGSHWPPSHRLVVVVVVVVIDYVSHCNCSRHNLVIFWNYTYVKIKKLTK